MNGSAREVYARFIQEQLEAQETRKRALESRANQLITVSAALVTLLFGLTALATRSQNTYVLPHDARSWLYGALVFFVSSSLLAIAVSAPILQKAIDPGFLMDLVANDEYWVDDSAQDALQRTTIDRAELAADAKRLGDFKGFLLVVATGLQVAGVMCVAGGVAAVLMAAPVAD